MATPVSEKPRPKRSIHEPGAKPAAIPRGKATRAPTSKAAKANSTV